MDEDWEVVGVAGDYRRPVGVHCYVGRGYGEVGGGGIARGGEASVLLGIEEDQVGIHQGIVD